MRLVAWNCAMAFHRKASDLAKLRPDIAVIAECADPDVLGAKVDLRRLGDMVWVGDNPHKGLAVFARNGYHVELDDHYDPDIRHIAPIRVSGPRTFSLLAVWAQNLSGGISRKDQPGPFREALDHYAEFLRPEDTVIAGDLNNNAIWDRPGWPINYHAAADRLAARGLVSAYHELRGEVPGQERAPTIYWRDRKLHGPRYHLDYVFAPRAWLPKSSLQVGSFRKWVGSGLSDHVPLVYEHHEAAGAVPPATSQLRTAAR